MLKSTLAAILLCSLALPAALFADEKPAELPAVKQLEIAPDRAVFDTATRNKPIEITSADDAKKHFKGDALKSLTESVDWSGQAVLVFAWRGSGQDRMAAEVDEDADGGPVIAFVYSPGRTRDLRPHTYVYAVKKGIDWSVK